VNHCARLESIPIDIISKFLWIPALIWVLTCPRPLKSITRAGLHRLLCFSCGNCTVGFHDFTNVVSTYSGHLSVVATFAARFYFRPHQQHVVSSIYLGNSSWNALKSNILNRGYSSGHHSLIRLDLSSLRPPRHLHGSPYHFVCNSSTIFHLF